MSQHHAAIKNDPRWKAARAACLARDGYACVHCGEADGLQAHHLHDLATNPELAFDVDNLETVCQDCHTEITLQGPTIDRQPWVHPDYATLIGDLVFSERNEKTPAVSAFHPDQPE